MEDTLANRRASGKWTCRPGRQYSSLVLGVLGVLLVANRV